MKSFLDFRNNWLTKEKESELINQSMEQTKDIKCQSQESFLATFSARFFLPRTKQSTRKSFCDCLFSHTIFPIKQIGMMIHLRIDCFL